MLVIARSVATWQSGILARRVQLSYPEYNYYLSSPFSLMRNGGNLPAGKAGNQEKLNLYFHPQNQQIFGDPGFRSHWQKRNAPLKVSGTTCRLIFHKEPEAYSFFFRTDSRICIQKSIVCWKRPFFDLIVGIILILNFSI